MTTMTRKRKNPSSSVTSSSASVAPVAPTPAAEEDEQTCPISLEKIEPNKMFWLNNQQRRQAYDVTSLWNAINADPLHRDPLTREPLSRTQLQEIITKMTQLHLIAPGVTVGRLIAKTELVKKSEELKSFLVYQDRADLVTHVNEWAEMHLQGIFLCSWRRLQQIKREFATLEVGVLTAVRLSNETRHVMSLLSRDLEILWHLTFNSPDFTWILNLP